MSVRILNPSFDDFFRMTKSGQEKVVILRGVIDPDSLSEIRSDDYQREVLRGTKHKQLKAAVLQSAVPDVELGVRGDNFDTENIEGRDVIVIRHHVHVIDGLQRLSAGCSVMGENPTAKVRIGAKIHFNTTRQWEMDYFQILNQQRTRVSPNVLLRNERDKNRAIKMLFNLTAEGSPFVLAGRVQWSQLRGRKELITALNILRVSGILHSAFMSGGRSNDLNEMFGSGTGIEKIMDSVGEKVFRANIAYFFDLIDECWGIKDVAYVDRCTHMKGGFLTALAELMCRHNEFWTDRKALFVDKSSRGKLKKFSIADPEVIRLAGSNGMATKTLYVMLLDHMNSGRRTRRLETPMEGDSITG
jgi:hypothetical protein